MYSKHLAPDPEPYRPGQGNGPFPDFKESWFTDRMDDVKAFGGATLDAAKKYLIRRTADRVLEAKLPDLFRYYNEPNLRSALRACLSSELEDIPAGTRVMVIGHSMGSIIAYDTLREMGKTKPKTRIEHFVTIGSPLGLPHVRYKIQQENDLVRTPTIVERWTSFADRRDPVTLDARLADDFAANDRGIKVVDEPVSNNYVNDGGDRCHYHKLYSYLRTPEFSERVRGFL